MVTISEILKMVVESLPPITIGSNDYTINFFDGVLDDAKEQMNTYKKVNEMPYPCIWLIREFDQLEEDNRVQFTNLVLIALIDTENSYQTPERLDDRINPYLIPIIDDLVKGLRLSGVYVDNKRIRKLTSLNSASSGVNSNNSKANSRIFADYLDGARVTINASYSIDLKTVCYEFR